MPPTIQWALPVDDGYERWRWLWWTGSVCQNSWQVPGGVVGMPFPLGLRHEIDWKPWNILKFNAKLDLAARELATKQCKCMPNVLKVQKQADSLQLIGVRSEVGYWEVCNFSLILNRNAVSCFNPQSLPGNSPECLNWKLVDGRW